MNCEMKSLTPIVKYRGNFEFMKDNCQVTLYFEFGKEYQKVTKGEYGEYISTRKSEIFAYLCFSFDSRTLLQEKLGLEMTRII